MGMPASAFDIRHRLAKQDGRAGEKMMVTPEGQTAHTKAIRLDAMGRKLADLVCRLSDVEGIAWIRLHYAFPSGFPMDVLDVMQERSNVCNYLDMPLQHGTDEMLKAMRRGITEAKTDALIDAIRQRMPDIAIRTTLICGFPGETEAHFEHLQGWVERMRFDRLGCLELQQKKTKTENIQGC